MSNEIVKLVPAPVRDRESVRRILDLLEEAYTKGDLTAIAAVGYEKGHIPYTYLSSSLTFAQTAWASKLLDKKLNEWIDERNTHDT